MKPTNIVNYIGVLVVLYKSTFACVVLVTEAPAPVLLLRELKHKTLTWLEVLVHVRRGHCCAS